jgi:hypothetical protein
MKTARDGTPRDHKWTAVDASNGSCRTRSHAGTPLSYSRTDRHPNTPKKWEAQTQKLERLRRDAICALRRAGLDKESARLRRAIEPRQKCGVASS